MDNFVPLLDTYTYNSTSKKVSRGIVKKLKVEEDLEQEVTKKHMLIENTSIGPISTIVANCALVESAKDNIAAMTHKIQTKDMEIARLKLELQKSRKQVTTPIVNTISFDDFL